MFFATHKCNRICRRMGLQNFRTNEESLMSGSDTELEDEREDELGYDDVLRRLARTLDDVEKMDVGLTAADDLGTVLPDVVVDALPLEPIQDAAADSAAVLLREPHRELGKMLLDDDDGLTRARPEAALYHLAAAALGGDGEALEFLRAVRAARDERRRWSEAHGAAALRSVAAVAILAAALYNVGSLLARRRRR